MMTVKSVLSLVAANLGREDLVAAVCDCNQTPVGEVSSLLRCYNLVENEIALDYFPLKAKEEFARCEKLPFTRFAHAPVAVLSVTDGAGNPVDFETTPSALIFGQRGTTPLTVVYSYSPAEKRFMDEVEFSETISERLLSFGVASEYLLTCGRFSEAATWEKKYREALRAATKHRRPVFVRSRRWA